MDTIRIEYPEFPEEIQIAEKRRAKYFAPGDPIPLKYCANDGKKYAKGKEALASGYIWKASVSTRKTLLYDVDKKQFVVKNPQTASRPRFVSIAGNDIMRMHPGVWQKIVNHLKGFFMTKLGTGRYIKGETGHPVPQFKPIFLVPFAPMKIRIEIHTFPRYMNWDLSNLWIYNKCFEDAMQEAGVIPNDNIRYITLPGAPEFVPVTREVDRKMVFIIEKDTDARRSTHLMYSSMYNGALKEPYHPFDWEVCLPFNSFDLDIVKTGSVGDVLVDATAEFPRLTINIGKTEKLVKVGETLQRVRHQCYQLNMVPFVEEVVWKKLEFHFRSVFLENGIPVYTDKSTRDETQENTGPVGG